MELAEFEQEVDNIIQRYGIKTEASLEASSRPPTQMSTGELHEFLRTSDRFVKSEQQRLPLRPERVDLPVSPMKENEGVKAHSISKAMRALQDRIKGLEAERNYAIAQLKDAEERFNSERNKWQSRVMEEISQASSKEKSILTRFSDVETENTNLNEKCLVQQEQLKILESQVKILQNENRHFTETYEIDRDNFQMQLDYAQKELGLKREAEKHFLKDIKTLEAQLAEAKEELRQTKLSLDKLTSETTFVRKNADLQRIAQEKNVEQMEATYSKLSQEQAHRIKQLELQLRRLKEEVKSAEKTADYWKKETQIPEAKPVKLKRAHSQAKAVTATSQHNASIKKKPKQRLKKSPSIGKLSETATLPPKYNLSPPKMPFDRIKTVTFDETLDSQSEIRALEMDVSALNRNYKQLLRETSEDTGNLSTLRAELNAIAEQMEQKTSRLYNLKREQQALLKSRMSSM